LASRLSYFLTTNGEGLFMQKGNMIIMPNENRADLSRFKTHWKSPYVARSAIGEFSGKLFSPRGMANLDSKGKGPPRVRIGRKICYPVEELILWMEHRSEVL
jgi:hypothetical protein